MKADNSCYKVSAMFDGPQTPNTTLLQPLMLSIVRLAQPYLTCRLHRTSALQSHLTCTLCRLPSTSDCNHISPAHSAGCIEPLTATASHLHTRQLAQNLGACGYAEAKHSPVRQGSCPLRQVSPAADQEQRVWTWVRGYDTPLPCNLVGRRAPC